MFRFLHASIHPSIHRTQISRWFVVLASSSGAGGGLAADWSGVGIGGGDGGGGGGGSGAGAAAVMVKRALLADITRLCVFFGFENTLDSILPQLITFLNDRYPMLLPLLLCCAVVV